MTKKYLRNLLVLTLVFIISCTAIPFKVYAASYFTGNTWNKNVVSVYIDDTPSPSQGGVTIPSYLYTYWRSNISEAIERWDIYLNNVWDADISFIYADSASSADVIIKYGKSSSWAQTIPTTYSNTHTFKKVNILISDWSFYQYSFDAYTQMDIVAHELGHALGLADIQESYAATNNIYSIMVNSVYPQSAHFSSYPTDFDGSNINLLY